MLAMCEHHVVAVFLNNFKLSGVWEVWRWRIAEGRFSGKEAHSSSAAHEKAWVAREARGFLGGNQGHTRASGGAFRNADGTVRPVLGVLRGLPFSCFPGR